MTQPESERGALRAVLVATAIAGVAGYVVQLLAPARLDETGYVSFSVFWSTMYLGGAAISGVQQEIARATNRGVGGRGTRDLLIFGALAALVVAAAALVVGIAFGSIIIPSSPGAVAGALVIGFVGYLATSLLTGIFYGLHQWTAVAFIVISDALLRVLLVVTGLVLGWSVDVLAFLIVLPFGAAAALSWTLFRRRLTAQLMLDIGLGRLAAHVAGTAAAAAASGVMISGLPMLVGITSPRADPSPTAALLLAITVTRAPIVIPVIALQSYLISTVFRRGAVRARRLVALIGGILAGGLVLALIGWFAGPPIISLISSDRYEISSLDAALIVFSAALTAGMCLSGPALISVRRHALNAAGWIIAAVLTVGFLALPLPGARIELALIVAPLIGLAVHIVALVWRTPLASVVPSES